MSIKLSPVVSHTGLNFKEYNSLLLPANQRSASAKKTDLNTFHTTGRKSQRKNHPVNLPPHQLQKWRGGGREHPTTWAGCNTHRTATRPHGTAASAPMPAKDTATGWVGTQAPRSGLLTPKGTTEAGGIARRTRRKSLKLKGKKLHRAGVREPRPGG